MRGAVSLAAWMMLPASLVPCLRRTGAREATLPALAATLEPTPAIWETLSWFWGELRVSMAVLVLLMRTGAWAMAALARGTPTLTSSPVRLRPEETVLPTWSLSSCQVV